MSQSNTEKLNHHLTDDEVRQLLDIVEELDPIVVGGQAINLWVQYFRALDENFLSEGAYTSKDIDFYRNHQAAERLAVELDGEVLVPSMDDASPNAALVIGRLGNKTIQIDFMSSILGVEGRRIDNNHVVIEINNPLQNRPIRILILHPLDCLRSRLANINILKRSDNHSISQAMAAQEVLPRFLSHILDIPGQFRHVQGILIDLSYTIKTLHAGKDSHFLYNLSPDRILDMFQNDDRLDIRWRENILAPCRHRVAGWLSSANERRARSQAMQSRPPEGPGRAP